MNAASKYWAQGARAFGRSEARESCRYKAADIVREWQDGWDAAQAKRAESERAAAVVRWQEYGARLYGAPTQYHLRGDAPQITVHHRQYDEANEWHVSCLEYGIKDAALGTTDAEAAKRLAVVRVRGIMHERLTALTGIAEVDGSLLTEVQS
jgi:ribosome modulation factor